jgi:pimeloyl-ACP methyl ester carboxylesterase
MVDTIVPFHESERMFASANQPKQLVLLPHCGHNDMGVYDTREFNDGICRFIAALK